MAQPQHHTGWTLRVEVVARGDFDAAVDATEAVWDSDQHDGEDTQVATAKAAMKVIVSSLGAWPMLSASAAGHLMQEDEVLTGKLRHYDSITVVVSAMPE